MGRGTARRAVEGQRRCDNCLGCGIHIGQNFGSGNMKDGQAERVQHEAAVPVMLSTIAAIMRFAVDLDNQLGVSTIEIRDVASDRMLAAKLSTTRATTQALP